MSAIVRTACVSKAFGPNRVLREVTFGVRAGTIHALVGENGAGKSTLMNILGGVHRPDEGCVMLDGGAASFAGPPDAIRQGIRTVHQELSLFPNRSVAQNIFSHREPTGRLGFIRWPVLHEAARRTLSRIASTIDPMRQVSDLSVGEQQMVEIARALSERARVLILDEPTSALSEPDVERLFVVLRELRSQGVAIIYISHKLGEVLHLADEVSVLRDGRLVGAMEVADATEERLVRLMVGREIDLPAAASRSVTGDVILSVEGLTRRGAFQDVSFSVRAGEILGFAGLIGSGRTEIARAIFGADRFDRGRVLVDGRPAVMASPRQAIRRGIGYLSEDRKAQGLFLSMSVRANIVAASEDRFVSPRGFLRTASMRAASARLVRDLDVRPLDDDCPVSSLSGGNQQKVLLAKWLCAGPRVLIADEPTRGVDVGAKAAIHRHLQALADRGLAVILISSELPEVLALSDRIAVFRAGRIAAVLDGRTASQEEVMRHAAA